MKAGAIQLALAAALLAAPASAQQYRFPIELPSSGTQPYITAYRDLDGSTALKDWNCGTHTYNGHKGTDIGIGSFPVMDAGSRWIVAAAPGKVVVVNDGCADRCTTGDCGCGSGFGNYVKVEHADGKSTYYAHMMKGSLQVAVGNDVSCGQHLGKVGSSGNSTGPHLHFEVRYATNTSDDPYSGSCGGPASFWVSQGAYKGLPSDQCEKPAEVDAAKLIALVPAPGTEVTAGASFEASFTYENTGNTTWSSAGSYSLAHDAGESFGASGGVGLQGGASVSAGQSQVFTVTLSAPTSPGSHSGSFRMTRGATRFGDTATLEIQVLGAPSSGGAGAGTGGEGAGWSQGSGGLVTGSGGKGSGQQSTVMAGESEGCACRAAGAARPAGAVWLLAAALLLALRRRRSA
ncbi:MAG: peptidoglycan DD-metalloendopeptidase family protein [Polyangiaceae bacterium]|nr:peptidoglycan DD-metalloendopeptidase family protein [Polyangiaceae bacterium]